MRYQPADSLGGVVMELRWRAGITQRELGAAVGLSQPSICELERGHTTLTVGRAAQLLGALHRLVKEREERPN